MMKNPLLVGRLIEWLAIAELCLTCAALPCFAAGFHHAGDGLACAVLILIFVSGCLFAWDRRLRRAMPSQLNVNEPRVRKGYRSAPKGWRWEREAGKKPRLVRGDAFPV